MLDAGAVVVPRLSPDLIRHAPESNRKLLELLRNGLGWPIPAHLEEIPLLDFSPEELHLDPAKVARLTKIQQLPKLVDDQTFAAFVLSFKGGSLPQGAIRRLVARLVKKRRASRTVAMGLWEMQDIIFFCVSEEGNPRLHIVSFRELNDKTVIKVISWSNHSPENKIELLARRELTDLIWGDLGVTVDARKRAFSGGYRQEIRSAQDLASQMAEIARHICDEINELLTVETEKGSLRTLFEEVKRDLRSDLTHESFADMYAQTMVYGLLASRVAHPENFRNDMAVDSLKFDNPFLDALYSSFRKRAENEIDVDEFGLQDLVQALTDTDVEGLLANFGTDDLKDDPVVFFYQHFLDEYDPKQRRELGAFYTPIPVVRFMVRAVDEIIKTEFGLPLGVADQTTWGEYSKTQKIAIPKGLTKNVKVIRMIDPATGTGTFLLEWMRQASSNLKAASQYSPQAMELVVQQMDAFEISLSSYAVAHLKTSLELDPSIRAKTHMGIRLTDTLAGRVPSQGNLFDGDPIAREGQLAEQVKFETRHSVVIGNPPYLRLGASANQEDSTGVMHGGRKEEGGQLLSDFLEPLRQAGLGVHAKNLYNLYAYFWRWSVWKVSEQNSGPSVIGFITASSFLNGPAFAGMRQVMRHQFDRVYLLDLGGEGRGSRNEENVFDGVQTPVVITIAVKLPKSDRSEARVQYLDLRGTKSEMFARLSSLRLVDGVLSSNDGWLPVARSGMESFLPISGKSFHSWPHLNHLFPWQHSGGQPKRQWIIGETARLLESRWKTFTSMRSSERSGAFGETRDRKVSGTYPMLFGDRHLQPLRDVKRGGKYERICRYGFRSFDRQWVIADGRLGDYMKRVLWQTESPTQVFLVTLTVSPLGSGPAATVSAHVPDMPYFRGSFGSKDVIPLYRDEAGSPNCDLGIVNCIQDIHRESSHNSPPVSAESLFAYTYGLLAGANYTNQFREELSIPNSCHIPITRNPKLFTQMVEFGSKLLWLQTFGERFRTAERKALKCDPIIKWSRKPTRIPDDSRDFNYDAENQALTIADGKLTGVSNAAWDFEVSGMTIIKKWLGYRTTKGAGRAASSDNPLDKIRPTEWEPDWSDELREIVHVLTETEKLRPQGVKLLEQILEGKLITADELPKPPDDLRLPPSREVAVDHLDLGGTVADDEL